MKRMATAPPMIPPTIAPTLTKRINRVAINRPYDTMQAAATNLSPCFQLV